jgi:diguanylate cyclase
VVNWSRLPDLGCAVLMIWTFGSASRDKQNYVSEVWMLGWVMILIHSVAALFTQIPGIWGEFVNLVFSVTLVWAGLLFSHASMPQYGRAFSRRLLGSLGAASFVYMAVVCLGSGLVWAMNIAAVLVAALPLAVIVGSVRALNDWRLRAIAAFCSTLSILLLSVQNRRPYGTPIAWEAFLFVVYLASACFAASSERPATAGTKVTVCGFFGWALVFLLEPLLWILWPQIHVETEIWHLPAFVVAMGMMLILLENQLKQSRHLALHDELTGLSNRRLFEDRLENALTRVRRTGETLGLLTIDLDRFKQVNDNLGHQAGDNLLRQVSGLFARRLRRSDTLARTGGDEFCAIVESPASRADLEAVGHALSALLIEPIQLGDVSVRVGASVGAALFPDDGEDADSLYRVADLRMYAVKRGLEGTEKESRSCMVAEGPEKVCTV